MSPEGSSIVFQGCPASLGRPQLRAFYKRLVHEVTGDVPFNCLITGDRRLQQLNRDFLGHDYPTDVLSFPSGDSLGALGDLAVSVDRAAAQAAEFGHTVEQEVQILMLHGALHLLGMDHEADGGGMARAEAEWRVRLELPDSLIGRNSSRRARKRA